MASREHDSLIAALVAARAAGDADAVARLYPRTPPDVRTQAITAGDVPAEWVSTPGARSDRALLYLHGGGYTEGSPATHRELISRLVRRTSVRALGVRYRLAPTHTFPAAVDDALSAWRWLTAQLPPERIAIVGDSAGGGLGLALMMALRDAGEPGPCLGAFMCPWADLEITGDSATCEDPLIPLEALRERGRLYAGPDHVRDPLASPLHGDFKGLPPLFLQTGDREILLDDSRRVAAAAAAAGVSVKLEVWAGMTHVWHIWGDQVPEAVQATAQLSAEIAKTLAR